MDYDESRDVYSVEYRDWSKYNGGPEHEMRVDRDVTSDKIRNLSIFWEGDELEVSYHGLWYRASVKDYLHQNSNGPSDGPHIVYLDYPTFQEWDVDPTRIRMVA